jgi:hypothetical protein
MVPKTSSFVEGGTVPLPQVTGTKYQAFSLPPARAGCCIGAMRRTYVVRTPPVRAIGHQNASGLSLGLRNTDGTNLG